MSALQKEVLKKHLPPLPSQATSSIQNNPGRRSKRRDYSPLPWSDFFDYCEDITVNGTNTFRVYTKGDLGPALLCLHGGGHSALSWACFANEMTKITECKIIAIDIRGHGDTVTSDDEDLSSDQLVSDIRDVFAAMYCSTPEAPHPPPTILVGHSMGGAIAVRVAAANAIPSLIGIAVIDIVEGTAMDSLVGMQSFLRNRPQSFQSVEEAIEWSLRSGQLRNRVSARVSMPGQVKRVISTDPMQPHTVSLHEEDETDSDASSLPSSAASVYKWRIDLSKTEQYWKGWFEGLSKTFLTCTPEPKILILAGVDRLDKDLTIGQMQGKFQMMVLKGCGHAVHEDLPDRVAEIISTFLIRYNLTSPKNTDQSTSFTR